VLGCCVDFPANAIDSKRSVSGAVDSGKPIIEQEASGLVLLQLVF
jgi:hypothetical protein